MTGLDKIVQEILSEADSAAAVTLAAARQQAEKIVADAIEQGAAQSAEIIKQSAAETADSLNRAKSAAALQKKKNVLVSKLQIIRFMYDRARQCLYTMPPESYFAMIIKMACKFSLPQEGDMLFSKADLDRLPAGFEAALNKAVKDKGAVLHISDTSQNIDGGFILVYGGVEENCSFKALFDAEQERLLDKVQELLFL